MMQFEEQEQIMLFKWTKLQEKKYPQLKWLYHIPNGGQRNKATAARLKAAGVKAGVPDLCLPCPMGGYAGLYIELKYGKNKPSKSQHEWLEYLTEAGYYTAVCYGFAEAVKTLKDYLSK